MGILVRKVSIYFTKQHNKGGRRIYEGLDWGGGVWYSIFIKNLAHYSSH